MSGSSCFIVHKLRNLLFYDIASDHERPYIYGILVLLKEHLPDIEYLELFTIYLASKNAAPADLEFYTSVIKYIEKYG